MARWSTVTEIDRTLEYIDAHPGQTETAIAAGLGKPSIASTLTVLAQRKLCARIHWVIPIKTGRRIIRKRVWHYFGTVQACVDYQLRKSIDDPILGPYHREQQWRNLGEHEIRREMDTNIEKRLTRQKDTKCA